MSDAAQGMDKLRQVMQDDPKRFMDFIKRKADEGKKDVYD